MVTSAPLLSSASPGRASRAEEDLYSNVSQVLAEIALENKENVRTQKPAALEEHLRRAAAVAVAGRKDGHEDGSVGTAPQSRRSALQSMPMKLKEEILLRPVKQDATSKPVSQGKATIVSASNSNNKFDDRASRWMRPKGSTPDKVDMKTILEKRIGEMRYRT